LYTGGWVNCRLRSHALITSFSWLHPQEQYLFSFESTSDPRCLGFFFFFFFALHINWRCGASSVLPFFLVPFRSSLLIEDAIDLSSAHPSTLTSMYFVHIFAGLSYPLQACPIPCKLVYISCKPVYPLQACLSIPCRSKLDLHG
jgi:hypothetical protein